MVYIILVYDYFCFVTCFFFWPVIDLVNIFIYLRYILFFFFTHALIFTPGTIIIFLNDN